MQENQKCNSIFAWTETKTIVKKIVKKRKTCKAGGAIDNWLNGKKSLVHLEDSNSLKDTDFLRIQQRY